MIKIKTGIVQKTVGIIVLTVAIVIITILLFSRLIIIKNYLKLEEENTIKSVEQAKNTFEASVDELGALAQDYATWDENYFFMINNDVAYIDSTFNNAAFDNLGLNFYVLFDMNGVIKYIFSYDLVNKKRIEATNNFKESLSAEVKTIESFPSVLKHQGLFVLDGKPAIIAIKPILKSSGEGPQNGTLAMGKYVDKSFENDISSKAEQSVIFYNMTDPAVELNFKDILNNFSKPAVLSRHGIYIEYFSNSQLNAYYLIKKPNLGNPILLMYLPLERDLYLEGTAATKQFVIILIVVAAVGCVLVSIFLRKIVLSRITRLSKEVIKIGKSLTKYSKLTSAKPRLGKDEVSDLTESIDKMLADLQSNEQQLKNSEKKFRDLIEFLPTMIIEIDKNSKATFANTIAFEILGYTKKDFKEGIYIKDILLPEDLKIAEERMSKIMRGEKPGSFEYQIIKRDGTTFPALISTQLIKDNKGNASGFRSVILDITERKIMEDTVKKLAYYDPLTNLPNRILFNERLKLTMADAARHGKKVAYTIIDMDKFKDINDKYGHKTGDEMLIFMGKKIESLLRKNDTIARFGGDEFLMLLTEIDEKKDTVIVLKKIFKTFEEKFIIGDYKLKVDISMGISFYPDDGTDSDTLFRKADTALYQVKESGRNNYKYFTS